MTRIAAVHPVLPPNVYDQAEITDRFAAYCLGEPDGGVDRAAKHALVRRLHTSASVSRRHLALPIDRYPELDGFGAANDAFIEVATELGGQAILGALDEAGLRPDQVDYVVSTTVTGAAVPSIEARIATEIGLRPDVRRVPLFGLGCVAGASGLARLHDLLRGDPKAVGVLLSVELCSLTVQRDDPSTANLVASGLFGDGAAAVVAVGDEHPGWGPTIVDSRAHLYPDTQRAMGWDIGGSGLKIVLGAEVPDLVTEFLGEDVRQFLKAHDLDVGDVTAWVAHPGWTEGARRDAGGARPDRRRARPHLALAGPDRQPLLVVGAARAARHPRPARPGRQGLPACCSRWVPASAPSSCCCAGDLMAAYLVFLLAICVERLAELVVSARHVAALKARGGIEYGAGHYPAMVALHVAMLVGCFVEPVVADRPFIPVLGWSMVALVLAAMALRWWCIRDAGRALEHPRHRGAVPAAGDRRAVPLDASPELRRRGRRGRGAPDGPHRVGDRASASPCSTPSCWRCGSGSRTPPCPPPAAPEVARA